MKAAIYLKDADEKQAAALRAWVAAKGFKDITEYRDVTPSRGRSGDKELRRLLQDAEERKFEFVFIDSLKQLDLDPSNVLLLIVPLRSWGVRLISRAEDWADLSAQDLGLVFLAYCQHLDSEADMMSLSSRSGRARAKKKHKPIDDRDLNK
jgi:hypothetical protein